MVNLYAIMITCVMEVDFDYDTYKGNMKRTKN